MEEDPSLLKGEVEIDEAYIGQSKLRKGKWGGGVENKQAVMGMIERKGRVYLKHVSDTSRFTLVSEIKRHVNPTARVITDQHASYQGLNKLGYKHDFVNHSETYLVGDIYTQNIEGFWSGLKRGIYGVYRHVSKEYLQNYANEYAWRFNNRHLGEGMFDSLLNQVAFVKVAKPVSKVR